MNIEEQIQIVEDNLNEYGQCNITLEEFDYLKKQIRADAIEEVLSIINAIINGVHQEFKKNGDMVNLGVICELQRFRDKLKEQKNGKNE